MAKSLQFRRGSTAGLSTITGAEGELFVDLSKDTVVVMDGTTTGGQALQKELTASSNLNVGVVTATSFSTGSGTLGITTNSITGPATITLDPAAVGDNTGTVVIKGDLQIDGTTTTINSTTVTVDDKNIVLADGAINNAAADGSGITVTSGEGNKTFQFESTGSNFGSSENVNVASGKVYKINNTTVLSSTQVLGKAVPSGTIVGDTDSQTLSNKTLSSATLSGTLTAGGGAGSNGQFLQSTGSGVQWGSVTSSPIAGCCTSNFLSCNTCAPNITVGGFNGVDNFFVGCNAGRCLTTGYDNLFLGKCAGHYNTSGQRNVFLGAYAGHYSKTGQANNYIGFQAGRSNGFVTASGSYNNIMGYNTGGGMTSGCYNNFFGKGVANQHSSGNCNIYMGLYAGRSSTVGCNNIFLGSESGNCSANVNNNIFAGLCAGWRNFSGSNNVFLGTEAGRCSVAASRSIYIGFNAGCLITGDCNVVIGSFTGTGFANCNNHIFLSDGAGTNRLMINGSGALGLAGANYGTSGQVLTSGGTAAAPTWTTIASSPISVYSSGPARSFYSCNTSVSLNVSGDANLFIGCSSGTATTSGNNNIFIGACSGCAVTTGCNNTFLGCRAGVSVTTAFNNIFLGNQAGICMTSGCHNVIFGGFCGCRRFGICMNTCSNHIAISDGQGCLRTVINNNGAVAFGAYGNDFGASGYVLTSQGSGSNPYWAEAPSTVGCCAYLGDTSESSYWFKNSNSINPTALYWGGSNFFAGYCAGYYACGSNNVYFGKNSAKGPGNCVYNTGNNNFFVGRDSGRCNTSGSNNIFFGCYTGHRNTTGSHNIFAGYYAGPTGYCVSMNGGGTGSCNIFFGQYSGRNNESGSNNFFAGWCSGGRNTTGSNNIFIGCGAGLCFVTGACNVIIGGFQGTGFATCCNHIFLSDGAGNNRLQINNSGALGLAGANYGTAGQVLTSCGSGLAPVWAAASGGTQAIAGCCTSTFLSCNTCAPNISAATNNFFVGCNAGACVTNGSNNVFLGCYSGLRLTTGVNNILIGNQAGRFFTTGINNVAIGKYAAWSTTFGCNNNFIGNCAGCSNTTGNYNNFFGMSAGICNTTGVCNTFIGFNSGYCNCIGTCNTFIGRNSGCLITGSCNVVIGSFAGTGFTACTNHIFLSDGAGNNRAQFNGSGAFGLNGANYGTAGQVLTSCGSGLAPVWASVSSPSAFCFGGTQSIVSCNSVSAASPVGSYNFISGYNAGPAGGNPQNNVAIGCLAGRYMTCNAMTANDNVFIGRLAGQYRSGGNDNIFIGRCSGRNSFSDSANVSGRHNTVFGAFAGACLNTGSYNFFAGFCAGRCSTTVSHNIAIGSNSGLNNTGEFNIFLGQSTGRSNSGTHNTFLGRCSGYTNGAGCNNTFIGQYSGFSNTCGDHNFFAGFCAGYDNTTGCNNIAIGCNSGNDALYDFGTTGGSNIIVIGNNSHVASYVKTAWTTGSDARDKTNIIPIPVGKEFLKQLNPIQYQWADRETGEITAEKPNYGFLAQDILALENPPQVIVDDRDPEHLKLRESMIVPVLVKTVQELIEEVDALKEEVRILKGQ